MLGTFLDSMKNKEIFTDKLEDGSPVFPYLLEKKESKILLVCGKNASGKSLLSRYMDQCSNRNNYRTIEVSMGERAKKGYMQQAMQYGKYGDEDRESTGHLTSYRVIKEFKKVEDFESPWFMILDEPDIGLSEAYARAMGEFIALNINEHKSSEHFKGLIVVSHNRALMQSLTSNLDHEPNKMRVGDDRHFDDWLESGEEAVSLEELLGLKEKTSKTRKRFAPYFKKR